MAAAEEKQDGFTPRDASYDQFIGRLSTDRQKLVDVAVKFLINPRVVNSRSEDKKSFLMKKGLNEEEIYWVTKEASTRTSFNSPLTPSHVSSPPPLLPHPQQDQLVRHYSWHRVIMGGVVIGGVVGLLFYWIKNFLEKWLSSQRVQRERLEGLEASVQQLQANLTTTVNELKESTRAIKTLLEKQQLQLNTISTQSEMMTGSSLHSINSDLATLKGLLLNRHQFPTPQRDSSGGTMSGIPSWQRSPGPLQIPIAEASTSVSQSQNNEFELEEENTEVETS